eukprot:1019671-Rhodomonas_salina.1
MAYGAVRGVITDGAGQAAIRVLPMHDVTYGCLMAPGNLTNSAYCRWTIAPAGGGAIHVHSHARWHRIRARC